MGKCSIFPQMFPFYSQNGYFFQLEKKWDFVGETQFFPMIFPSVQDGVAG